MKERIIIFRDINAKGEEIVVNTNAPREEIEKAISFMNNARGDEAYDYLCDFEIIQNYLEEQGYSFYDFDIEEKYYW